MVELANVSFAYETDVQATHAAVRDINLSVGVGECVLLCGPSGGGKSTVLKLVNGVIPHFSSGNVQGSIRIAGRDVSNMPLHERSLLVASVFQNPKSQFFNTDVESEIAFALENQGLAAEEITCRLARTIEELHLEGLCKRSMFALSGGQKQRVAFASAAIAQTPVVVLDEPLANLDNASIELIAGAIRLLKTRGVSVLIAKHRLNYLQGIVDTAYFVEEGTITRRFTGDELYGLSDAERRSLGLRSLVPDHGLPARGIGEMLSQK